MNWKIARDPFYSKLYKKYGFNDLNLADFVGDFAYDFIKSAGFMEDSSEKDLDLMSTLDIMCTPYHFMEEALLSANKPVVIVSTGSFAPMHSGHLEAMISARGVLTAAGYDVVGGYFAPDHDEYINYKLNAEAIPIHYRIKYIIDIIRDFGWIKVDPFAGLFLNCAVNFTDIIVRLKAYLKRHTGRDVDVVFLCGEDNSKFARTFFEDGMCVITKRDGYSMPMDVESRVNKGRIFYAEKSDNSSSTDIRKMRKWQETRKSLILRVSEGDLQDDFKNELIDVIRSRFDGLEIRVEEKQDFSTKCNLFGNIISLDPKVQLQANLGVSRLYDCFGFDLLGFTNRPGTPSLDEQIELLPYDKAFVLDDDIASGNTMRFVFDKLLEKGIEPLGLVTFTHWGKDYEILDLRDFVFDEPLGGLVIKTRGGNKRFPYVYPYVCPFIRGSINDPISFSMEITNINHRYGRYVK